MTNLTKHVSLKNKIIFITGASSGIGAACAKRFAAEGAKLLLCARRSERLEKLSKSLAKEFNVDVHSFTLDVTKLIDVETTIKNLPSAWQNVDVLINNAGLAKGMDTLQTGKISEWEMMIDTNVKGLLYVTRTILPGMVQRNQGHILNIGSIAGHTTYPKGAVYCASKQAVRAITQGLRMDLLGTKIRVSTVDPGMVADTEFSIVRYSGDQHKADATYAGMQPLSGDDIADALLYCATAPAHINIDEIIIMPVDQAAATLVSRK